MIRLIHIVGILACLFSNFSCQYKATTSHASGTIDSASCYTNPLLSIGGPAFGALFHNGMYYYIRGVDDKICLWALKDITEITHEPTKTIWPVAPSPQDSPQGHRGGCCASRGDRAECGARERICPLWRNSFSRCFVFFLKAACLGY